ncbi:MAG: DUF3592 domain-containing protein [Chloroflexota bacterium]
MKNIDVIFFSIGIILIGLGGTIFVREQLFIRSAEQAIAVVTGNESVSYAGNDVNEMGIQQYFCLAFQFQTRDGQTISFKETQGKLNQASCGNLGTLPDYEVGQAVPVYYDPRDPANSAQIPKLVKKYYSLAAAFAVAGVLLVLLGFYDRRQNKELEAAMSQQKIPNNYSPNPGWDKLMSTENEMKKKRK